MKSYLILLLSLTFITTQGQEWFDKSCKNIDDDTTAEAFSASQKRNILNVVINQAGVIELNGISKTNLSEIAFKELVLDFVTNPNKNKNKAEKPEKVLIQLKNLNGDFKTEDALKTYIQEVYLYLWDKNAEDKYSSSYVDLNCKKRAKIFNKLPLRLVPDVDEEKNKKPNHFLIPSFGGDVIDN